MKGIKIIIGFFVLSGFLFLSLVLIFYQANAEQKPAFKLGVDMDLTGQAAWLGKPAY